MSKLGVFASPLSHSQHASLPLSRLQRMLMMRTVVPLSRSDVTLSDATLTLCNPEPNTRWIPWPRHSLGGLLIFFIANLLAYNLGSLEH